MKVEAEILIILQENMCFEHQCLSWIVWIMALSLYQNDPSNVKLPTLTEKRNAFLSIEVH